MGVAKRSVEWLKALRQLMIAAEHLMTSYEPDGTPFLTARQLLARQIRLQEAIAAFEKLND